MTKFILKLVFFSICLISNMIIAQDFHGEAVYESKTKMEGVKITSNDMTEDMRIKMEERMKKAFEKTYILNFNKFESVYSQEVKLETPKPNQGVNIVSVSMGDGKKYKNIKEKSEISEEEFFGKEFLIQDSLPKWNWNLETATKKIGNYTCHKATVLIPASEEAKKAYEESKNKKKEAKTQFFEETEPKDKTIVVWYTPEIPVSQGPDNYWGLPGLILEVADGNTMILCSKIVLNPKEKSEIKKPNKGKKVSRKQYDDIIEKQMENMKDSNGNIEIRIGG